MHTRFAAIALFLAACGGSSTPGGNPGQSSSCSMTLSGAVTGTFDCRPATTVWSSSNNTGGFGFSVTTPAINVAIGWSGQPSGGAHYKITDSGASGGVTVQQGSGASTQVWAASAATGSNPAHGSYDLAFSSVSNAVTTSQGNAYSAEGTLSATLVPLTGQSGNVTVSVTF